MGEVQKYTGWPGTDRTVVFCRRVVEPFSQVHLAFPDMILPSARSYKPVVWLKWQLIKSIFLLLPAGLLHPEHDECTPRFHLKAVSSHFSTQGRNK